MLFLLCLGPLLKSTQKTGRIQVSTEIQGYRQTKFPYILFSFSTGCSLSYLLECITDYRRNTQKNRRWLLFTPYLKRLARIIDLYCLRFDISCAILFQAR